MEASLFAPVTAAVCCRILTLSIGATVVRAIACSSSRCELFYSIVKRSFCLDYFILLLFQQFNTTAQFAHKLYELLFGELIILGFILESYKCGLSAHLPTLDVSYPEYAVRYR